jgi:hypothetical protein
MVKMIRKNIISAGILLCALFALSGCGGQTQKPTSEEKLEVYKQETAAKELKQAEAMQLAAIQAQDKQAALMAKNNELAKKLETLQAEYDEYRKNMSQPESWEEKYNKSQSENDELRKLVQYERGLREGLLKKVEKDQITINELQDKLSLKPEISESGN